MLYFENFPKVGILNEQLNYDILTNIMVRAQLLPHLENNPMLFYTYDVQDEDTPEIVAHKYYGDSYRYWVLLYSNRMLNPQWDWPLSERAFHRYLDGKYQAAADAADLSVFDYLNSTIYRYEKVIKKTDLVTETTTEERITISQDDYNSLMPSTNTYTFGDGSKSTIDISKNIVTLYQYELDLNESRRTIKILNSIYITQIEKQFQTLMSQ